MNEPLKTLGEKVSTYQGLETFPAPTSVIDVTCVSDEVTAMCPVTGQPDWYTVTINYTPDKKCVESKTLKLFLQSFRQAGHFCENFSQIIAEGLQAALEAHQITVTVLQKPRGGVAIQSISNVIKRK